MRGGGEAEGGSREGMMGRESEEGGGGWVEGVKKKKRAHKKSEINSNGSGVAHAQVTEHTPVVRDLNLAGLRDCRRPPSASRGTTLARLHRLGHESA